MNGVVIKATGKRYTVKTTDGEIVQCRLKGKFRIQGVQSTNPIVVGDTVEVEQESELCMIVKLHERRNNILRKSVNLSKQTHIIAANIDQAILMITLDSPYADRRAEWRSWYSSAFCAQLANAVRSAAPIPIQKTNSPNHV